MSTNRVTSIVTSLAIGTEVMVEMTVGERRGTVLSYHSAEYVVVSFGDGQPMAFHVSRVRRAA